VLCDLSEIFGTSAVRFQAGAAEKITNAFWRCNMVEELEQEYAGLQDKVRDLREYL
jgi:hypothetical protein